MIISNSYLIDEIFSSCNMPEFKEDLYYYDNYLQQMNYLNLNDINVCQYLSRNVKKLNINLSKINENEYIQLYELLNKCNNLDIIVFTSLSNVIKVDNKLVDYLINTNIKKIVFGRKTVVEYNNLVNKLDQINDGNLITLASLENEESEIKYLKLPINDRRKLSVNKFSNELYEKIYNNQKYRKIDLELYFNYKEFFDDLTDFTILINNVGELNLEKLNILKMDSRINGIYIKCGYHADEFEIDINNIYSLDEYENILHEINNIISKIKMPNGDVPDKEKIIFAQLYSLVSEKIIYDYYAISDIGKLDKKLSVDCRNLKNGLLGVTRNGKKEYTCVCAGYATILQNICSVLGISCDYIRSNSKEVLEDGVTRFGNYDRIYENGTNDPMGHAYNAVNLDGESYLCDITWDYATIRANGLVTNFLKSYDDFYRSHHDVGFSDDNVSVITLNSNGYNKFDKNKYTKSISLEEQRKLFSFSMESKINEMINIGYLGGFVEQYIHFVKSCKNKVEIEDIYNILNTVNFLEEYILSDEFRKHGNIRDNALAIPVIINNGSEIKKENISFYNSSVNTVEEVVESVEKMVKHGR